MNNRKVFNLIAIIAAVVAIFTCISLMVFLIVFNKPSEVRNVSMDELMTVENAQNDINDTSRVEASGEENTATIDEPNTSLNTYSETSATDNLYPAEEVKECIYNAIYQKVEGNTSEVEYAISELEAMDAKRAEEVREIFAYWDLTKDSSYVNINENTDGFPEDDSLLIAVMGYQLNPDGSMKEELVGRLTKAKSLADKYPNSYILVTGGGTASSNREATEAGQMAKWLIKEGVDEKRIIVEDKSKDTADNSVFSYEIIKRDYPSIKKTVIVTSDFHIPMAGLFFEAQYILDDKQIEVIGNVPYNTNFRYNFTDEEISYFLKRLISNQKW